MLNMCVTFKVGEYFYNAVVYGVTGTETGLQFGDIENMQAAEIGTVTVTEHRQIPDGVYKIYRWECDGDGYFAVLQLTEEEENKLSAYRFTAIEMGWTEEIKGAGKFATDEQAVEWVEQEMENAGMALSLSGFELERRNENGRWELVNEGEVY